MEIEILTCGDSALTLQVGDRIDPQVAARVRALCRALGQIPGLELVPTYCGVTVHYDPLVRDDAEVRALVRLKAGEAGAEGEASPEYFELPVCYGGELGPDLPQLAAHCGLSEREVVDIHSGGQYLIYMLGFTPGFPYMGGMDKRIAMPRLETPRAHIPWGSVGIAGEQTGVYPSVSPGGWRLIGRTPLRLFDPKAGRTLLRAGMLLRFRPISRAEYDALAGGDRP